MSTTCELVECPICMEQIEANSNKVVTECSHVFHCSCLMKNAVHNGFACPLCRTEMAEQREENDDDDVWSDVSEFEQNNYSDEALMSFRLFQQQLNGEELEEEQEEYEEYEEYEEQEQEQEEQETSAAPAEFMVEKLLERGVTFESLAKYIMYLQEFPANDNLRIDTRYDNLKDECDQVFGHFNAIYSNYNRSRR